MSNYPFCSSEFDSWDPYDWDSFIEAIIEAEEAEAEIRRGLDKQLEEDLFKGRYKNQYGRVPYDKD